MIRSKLTGALALAFCLALGSPAFAQDKPLAPTDGNGAVGADADPVAPPTVDPAAPVAPPQVPATPDTPTVEGAQKDPGGWKGQAPAGGAPQAGVPEAAQDPLAAGNQAPAAPDPAEQAKNNRIIDKNYEAALKTYDNVLNNEGEPIQGLDHRIKTNENLIADYKKKLAAANEAKRRLQVELFNRTFYLKQQRDKGAIPEDVYEKLMKQEEKKYQQKSANTVSDIQFLEKEIGDAEKRLTELRAERRVNVTAQKTAMAAKGGPGKAKKPMKASERQVATLKDRLAKLNAFETKRLMDGYSVCEQCMAPHAAGGPHGGAPEGPAPEAPADK